MTPIDFIKGKITQAEKTLKSRVDMQKTCASGTNAEWRKVGCFQTKAERLKDSETHGRIAAKNRDELEMFKEVLEQLEAAQREYLNLCDRGPKA